MSNFNKRLANHTRSNVLINCFNPRVRKRNLAIFTKFGIRDYLVNNNLGIAFGYFKCIAE